MRKLTLAVIATALILTAGCKKEPLLSPEAEAMRLLITQDINEIADLLHFKVYDALLEVVISAWNSDQEDGVSYVTIAPGELEIKATHRFYDESAKDWKENLLDIPYEDIDNYLVQNSKVIDSKTGTTTREGNNLVIYLK